MHMALHTQPWTLEMLHRLPDDGNKYELVRGELFVTPPPSMQHETLIAVLARILDPYVEANALGLTYRARAVVRIKDDEVEPDLMVRQPPRSGGNDWENAPFPILLVEVISPGTRRRDFNEKRLFYSDNGVPEYWVVDADKRAVHVFRLGTAPFVVSDVLRWHPGAASTALEINLPELFARAGS
jgi:Uma2 family endonuclease